MPRKRASHPKPARPSYRRMALLGVVLVMAAAGTTWLMRGSAATFATSQEAETATPAGQAAKCDGLGASGNSFVRFGAADCADKRTFTNPVKVSTADPGVLKWEGRYYMVSTSGDPWFGIFVSDDLVNWRWTGKNTFNGPGTHPWGKNRFWAPELHRVGNRFAVYYSAGDSSGRLAIGAAFADSVTGPYTDLGRPLIRDDSLWFIDVNFFRDDDGRQYLYWKEDGGNTRIFGQEVDQAGTGLIGPRKVVLQKGLAWEGAKGIEGTWLMKKDGTYYMFYSGELFSSDRYAIGVARAGSPLASFAKKGDPILRSGSRWKGPGHNSVTQVGANHYMVYHAWDRTAGAGDRAGLVDKITWSNGWPAVGNDRPAEGAQPYPQ